MLTQLSTIKSRLGVSDTTDVADLCLLEPLYRSKRRKEVADPSFVCRRSKQISNLLTSFATISGGIVCYDYFESVCPS